MCAVVQECGTTGVLRLSRKPCRVMCIAVTAGQEVWEGS